MTTNKQSPPIGGTIPARALWNEIQIFFMEMFAGNASLDGVEISRGALIGDLNKYFYGAVDPEAVANLLKNGFETSPGRYFFERKDFTPPVEREVEP